MIFLPRPAIPELDFKIFVCRERGFAITHLFLKDFGYNKIMSFCKQHLMLNLAEVEIWRTILHEGNTFPLCVLNVPSRLLKNPKK